MDINQFIQHIKDTVNHKQDIVSPLQGNADPVVHPPSMDKYKQAITQGLANWGVKPDEQTVQAYVDAIGSNPLYQKLPFLLPAISIAETSGGAKTKQENNILNWGINLPQGYFTPQSPVEVIQKAASGIAGRTQDFTQRKGLEKFRQTGNLKDLADWYAPPENNPNTGGDTYAQNLQSIMDIFNKSLQQ